MEKSDSIIELAKALALFQGELKPAKKSEVNPFFKSYYADLAGVWDVCRVPLSKNGLSVIQLTRLAGDKTILDTLLLHVSGEWITSELLVMPIKTNDPQALGSALTYARRYALSAMLGVATEDDDDAETALGRGAESRESRAGSQELRTESRESRAGSLEPREHWCVKHQTPFFKTEKMRTWSHPIKDTSPKQWCSETLKEALNEVDTSKDDIPTPTSPSTSIVGIPEANKTVAPVDIPATLQEFLTWAASHGKTFGPAWVCSQLNKKSPTEIKDLTLAYHELKAITGW